MTPSPEITLEIGPHRRRRRAIRAGTGRTRLARRPGGTIPALLALYACWGAATPAMKLMVATVPPLTGAGAVFLAGAGVLGLGAGRRPRPTLGQARRAACAGTVMLVGGQGLATVALTRLSTSLVAVLEATIPLWVALLGAVTGRRASRASLARLVVGFAGITAVLGTAPHAALRGSGWALLAACVAPALWASGTLLQAGARSVPADPRTASAISLAAGGTALLALAALTGQLTPSALDHVSAGSAAAAVALLALDSLAGFTLYTRLLRTAPAELVSTYAYVVPVVAVAIGVTALGDHLWTGAVLGGAVVLVAIVLEMSDRRG